jgi:Asp/Glu/hydantoin racemase
MTPVSPVIALISATPAAIGPATTALHAAISSATVWNILDDRLLQDANAAGGVTAPLAERMKRLIRHAETEGADGILLTCSIYGPVAHQIASDLSIPVLAADDAAFTAAVDSGHATVLVVAVGPSQMADTSTRLRALADKHGVTIDLPAIIAEGAFEAALAHDDDALLASIEKAITESGYRPDAVLLAQYSLTTVTEQLADALQLPVYAGPQRAAEILRSSLADGAGR